jgi:hypothetical protein
MKPLSLRKRLYKFSRRRGETRRSETRRSKNKNIRKTKKRYSLPSTTKMKKLNCSPTQQSKDEYTCYNDSNLINIRNMWNKRNPDEAIRSNSKKEIWSALQKKMKNVCDNEMCWLKQEFIDDGNISKEMIENVFAPTSPKSWNKNPNEWLSNFDLKKVMKQYEKKYDNFSFIGPSPIDFDQIEYGTKCVWNDLCHFKLKSFIDRGKTKIGIIFNTDPHTEGGSHWISTFINIPEGYIYFFNSTGESVPHEIKVLIDRIIAESKELVRTNVLKKELVFNQNYPKQHQKGGTECGMYSLFFIVKLLTGELKPDYFNTEKVPDKKVEEFRKIFFNPSD